MERHEARLKGGSALIDLRKAPHEGGMGGSLEGVYLQLWQRAWAEVALTISMILVR